jgi:hypothetical protein
MSYVSAGMDLIWMTLQGTQPPPGPPQFEGLMSTTPWTKKVVPQQIETM